MGSHTLEGESIGRYYVLYKKNKYRDGLRVTYKGVLPGKYKFELFDNDNLDNPPKMIYLAKKNFVKKHEYLQYDNEWFARPIGGFSIGNRFGRYTEVPNNNSMNFSDDESISNNSGMNSESEPGDPEPYSQQNNPNGGTRRVRKKRNVKSKSRKSSRKSRKNRS